MLHQHTIEGQQRGDNEQSQGIVVPLDLPEFKMVGQGLQADGSIKVHVIATTDRQACPTCGTICVKIHDRRERKKRDIALGNHQLQLIVHKRRFRCLTCRRTFTERDSACGRYRRTTGRLREALAKEVMKQPVAHIAEVAGVGSRFVEECFEALAQDRLAHKGLVVEETAPLPTPSFLGIDEFACRKGHRYETILCDLQARTVLEVSEGRKLEDVQRL